MAIIISNDKRCEEMFKALGIENSQLLNVTLSFRPNEIVTVTTEYAASADRLEGLANLMREYHLVEVTK